MKKVLNKLESFGIKAKAYKADIRKPAEIKKMFGKIKTDFGKIDLLINNAAIFRKQDFLNISEKEFDDFINTNLKSVFFCCQETIRIMLKNKPGKIINIASLGGLLEWSGFMPYGIAKAGVIKLTKLLAKKYAPEILVNAIAPGTIEIPGSKEIYVNDSQKDFYPLKRFAKPEDITNLIIYLAKENRYITGHTFIVDGGRILKS